MAETLDYLIAQTVTIPAGTTVTLIDDLGAPRSVPITAGCYRLFAAQTAGGAGTEENPWELLHKLVELCSTANWNLTLLPSGRVRVTYLGATANGTMAFTSALVAKLLGFNVSAAGPFATGGHADGAYLPSHAVFFGACEDGGWVRTPGRFSGARMPSGLVYGWGDALGGATRKLTLRLLPKDETTRAALVAADADSAPPTACFGPTSRWCTPGAGEPAQDLPWGAVETLATAGARSLGAMLGTLQTAVATPADAPFERCYFTPETIGVGGEVRLSVDGFDVRRDIAAVELSYAATEARS
ncbi:MAG: hypothetical protein IPQ07_38090 [Myxococcales bacterium]|nr:hypothetical protein [Myxococcales bacterium]